MHILSTRQQINNNNSAHLYIHAEFRKEVECHFYPIRRQKAAVLLRSRDINIAQLAIIIHKKVKKRMCKKRGTNTLVSSC